MKAYFTTLAARPMKLSGRDFRFTVFSIFSGRANGYYETDNPEEIALLDDAVRARRGVKEMTLDELENVKKNQSTRPSLNSTASKPRVVRIPLLPELPVEGKGSAASVAAGVAKPGGDLFSGDAPTTPSIKSLLKIERVSPPQPFNKSLEKTVKASARADRAKVRVARRAADSA